RCWRSLSRSGGGSHGVGRDSAIGRGLRLELGRLLCRQRDEAANWRAFRGVVDRTCNRRRAESFALGEDTLTGSYKPLGGNQRRRNIGNGCLQRGFELLLETGDPGAVTKYHVLGRGDRAADEVILSCGHGLEFPGDLRGERDFGLLQL